LFLFRRLRPAQEVLDIALPISFRLSVSDRRRLVSPFKKVDENGQRVKKKWTRGKEWTKVKSESKAEKAVTFRLSAQTSRA